MVDPAAYRYEPPPEGGAGDDGTTLVVLPHAGAGAEELVALGRRVAPGSGVLCPVAPDGDPRLRAAALADLAATATAALGRSPEQVWGLGFSDGADLLVGLAHGHPDLLAGAAVLSGRLPFPLAGGKVLEGRRMLCARGRADDRVSIDEYEDMVEALVTAGAEVELHWYDTAHELSDAELDDVREWLRKQHAGG